LTLTQSEKAIAVTGRAKGLNEAFARFFEGPSREGLRDLFREHLGEANEFDFKRVAEGSEARQTRTRAG